MIETAAIAANTTSRPFDVKTEQASGMLGTIRVIKSPNMSQLVADLQEEAGFSEAERKEDEDSEEAGIRDRAKEARKQLLRRVQEAFSKRDDRTRSHQQRREEKLGELLAKRNPQNAKELFETIDEVTKDKGEALALLQSSLQKDNLDAKTKSLIESSLPEFIDNHAEAIQASVNTLAVADATASQNGLDAEKLQAFYQESVTSYQGILPVLTRITDDIGVANFETARHFLFQAIDTELASEQSSKQPEHLQSILAELQGVKIFNTIRTDAERLLTRHESVTSAVGFDRDNFTAHIIHAAANPSELQARILTPMQATPLEARLLFFQDLRETMRAMPDYLYANASEKTRVTFPLQMAIDDLVFKEGV